MSTFEVNFSDHTILFKIDQKSYMGGGGELARISPPPKKNFWKNIPPLQEGHSLANSPLKLEKTLYSPLKVVNFSDSPPKIAIFQIPPPKKFRVLAHVWLGVYILYGSNVKVLLHFCVNCKEKVYTSWTQT